ncbi:MAG: alanine-tRNA synthetase second additional domain-containing protein [Christensenellaceae bacterium]|nr:alanine-tRNA synthetase second additional domain-containing protein [Christensenellaceae bacterium]
MSFSGRMQNSHFYSVFFAPRGRDRIYDLGMQLAQMYLSPYDKLIGIIGESGSGKSMLIKGMFPGLELTNDDNGVNTRPLPILDQEDYGFFTAHTYHLDIRFEAAFAQMHELAEAILRAVQNGKRVIVEHFDMIYPFLKINAHLLIGVGEEIMVTRPTVFGPLPQEIYDRVSRSVVYRRMAHSAEDLCEYFMPDEDFKRCRHSDIKHGFVLAFDKTKPDFDLNELESKVLNAIAQDLTISYVDEGHILIGDALHPCTGPRTHMPSTGHIENFRLIKKYFYDPIADRYLLAGRVGPHLDGEDSDDLNEIDTAE